jgi:sugar lactone lactonase YvrE
LMLERMKNINKIGLRRVKLLRAIKEWLVFVASLLLAHMSSVAAPPATLSIGGQLCGAMPGATWQIYSVTNSSRLTSGAAGTAASNLWNGDVGNLEPSVAVGSELICALSQEANSGTISHMGYYAVMNHTLTGNDPAVFQNMTLQPIPIPSVTTNGVVSWSPAVEDPSERGVTNVIGYNVFRSPDGINFTMVNTGIVTQTSYEAIPGSQGYYYDIGLVYRGNPPVHSTVLSANSAEGPPLIMTQLTNSASAVIAGGSATFNVGLSGIGPLTYQWLFNGTNLTGLTNIITTIAGNGGWGYSGDGGPAIDASLSYPSGVAVDADGNLFIADTYNQRIRKVNASGIITTVAGNGNWGYSGDGGAATNASLSYPSGVAVDADGNLFIADTYNQRIRKVNASGIITTVAGNGNWGYSGDGGAAINASLAWPKGVAVDADGTLFIADTDNQRVRIDSYGIIITIAGNGSWGYSGDGGAAINASLAWPEGVAVDADGNLFIADSDNSRIREVDPFDNITTIAGNGGWGYSGDGGPAIDASLSYPSGVAVDADGNLFIADSDNSAIRKVVAFAGAPMLTLNNMTTNNAGSYSVIISNPYGSVTSSVVTLTVSLPLISAAPNVDGSVMLNLLTAPNTSSRVLAATNLTPPIVWQPIYTNVPGANGAWQFTDTNTSQYPVRFYRSSTP